MIRHNGCAIPPSKPTFIVVAGPAGCGKTANAELLKEMYRCESVLEDWTGSSTELLACLSYPRRCRAAGKLVSQGYAGMRILVLWTADPNVILDNAFHMVRDFMAKEGFEMRLVMFHDIEVEMRRAAAYHDAVSATSQGKSYPDVTVKLTPENAPRSAFVTVTSHGRGSSLIMQCEMVTCIETNISRQEGVAIAKALATHFGITSEELQDKSNLTHQRIAETCDHDWVRHFFPENPREYSFVCSNCGAHK